MLGLGLGLGLSYRYANAFSPSSISDLAFWLDASDASTIIESGGYVSQWNDKSGNGYNVSASSSYQPVTGAETLNGKNIINFSTTHWMQYSGLNFRDLINDSEETTIFLVKRYNSGTVEFTFRSNSDTTRRLSAESGNRIDIVHDSDGTLTGESIAGEFKILSGRRSGTEISLSYNGIERDSGTDSYTTTDIECSINVGAYNIDYLGADVDIAEIIIYKKALSDAEIDRIGKYLANKWGLAWVVSQFE